jgi:hypothetical protein
MKKSNKLLLAIILTAVLLLTAVHVALYAKYTRGDYTLYSGEDAMVPVLAQSFPHARFVAVRNLDNVAVTFGDTLKLESGNNDWKKTFSFAHTGDTLFVRGQDTIGSPRRNYTDLRLYLPSDARLAAFNTSLSVRNKDGAMAAALNLSLDNSNATLNGEGNAAIFGTVNITAIKNSTVELQSTTIKSLQASLSESALNDMAGTIDTLTVAADNTSRISLQSKHFFKATQPAHHD